jgi:predicted DCC family thiol-disulfide oxidoreductase YuxK
MADDSAVLLFDGTCGFCAGSVQFVLAHETREARRRTLRFASLQSDFGMKLRRAHPELERVDSVIWFEPGDAGRPEMLFVRSAAVLRVLRYLGGGWSVLAVAGRIVPRVIRDAVYDLMARRRHRLVRGGASCLLPSVEQRARFIEWDTAA